MVIVVPIYEERLPAFITTLQQSSTPMASISARYRKNHIPHVNPGFWEKFYFKPGNLGYPAFDTALRALVYICYDRHFPEGARG